MYADTDMQPSTDTGIWLWRRNTKVGCSVYARKNLLEKLLVVYIFGS